jgi:hypothetical protein
MIVFMNPSRGTNMFILSRVGRGLPTDDPPATGSYHACRKKTRKCETHESYAYGPSAPLGRQIGIAKFRKSYI